MEKYITENFYFIKDKLYTKSGKPLKMDNDYMYSIRTQSGNYKRLSLKTLYRLFYNKEYCIDNIQSLPLEEWKIIP